MAGGLTPFVVKAGGLDFTTEAMNLTFSSVDPGGYEMCTFDLEAERADRLNPGDRVQVIDGLSTVWEGRIAEPAKQIRRGWRWGHSHKVGATTTRVSAEGYGAALKDNTMSMVYIDRSLSRWQSWGLTRQYNMAGANSRNTDQFSWQVGVDTASGQPGIMLTAAGQLVHNPVGELWYDSGPFNLVSRVRFHATAQTYGFPDAGVQLYIFMPSDDVVTTYTISSNFAAASVVADFSSTPTRYGAIQHGYGNAGPSGVAGSIYGYSIFNLSVIGNHGLPLRGSDPNDGYYCSDIAMSVVQNANLAVNGANIRIGQVDTLSQFIVMDYAQYTPVPHEQILQDMARLAPAHFGTWENSSMFDDRPEWTFRAYNTEATAYMAVGDSDEIDFSQRLANLYTSAIITYTNAAGTPFQNTVTLPNYILDRVGIKRSTTLDLGLSSSYIASIFASYVLQALFAQARSAGTVTLPRRIRDKNGALNPSWRLKSGIDRIRINDVPAREGLFTGSDKDSYRISRIESNVQSTSGDVVTRVELDAGPNLVETMQARMQITNAIFGY